MRFQSPLAAPAEVADVLLASALALVIQRKASGSAHDFDFARFPQTDDDLSEWTEAATGQRIPTRAVCDDHDAPISFVADLFFERVTEALILANRAGGKTASIAALHLANGWHKPGFETSHIGAIAIQARRCYSYYLRGLRYPRLALQAPEPHISDTEWANGSRIEILPGTNAQTQGGHPHLATFDELEQGKLQPYENAKSMPVERIDASGKRHPGQFAACSTRENGLGLMQRALDEAAEKGVRIYTWCAIETIDGRTCRDETGAPLCEDCPLNSEAGGCQGRALAADGWRSREEVARVFARVGADTWIAQHLCKKPEARALIYAPFSRANITSDAEYVPGAGPWFVFYDWGFTDPTYFAMVQYRDGAFYQFDELSGSGRPEREWTEQLIGRICDLADYSGPTMQQWPQIRAGKARWPSPWPAAWPQAAAGDPSAVQLRSELKAHGFGVRSAAKVRHEVESGQDVLRAAIHSGGATRRLFIHPRCVTVIEAMGRYRARQLADGSFDPRPDPDPANHAYSHPLDALRYGVWSFRRLLGLGGPDTSEDTSE